MSPIASLLHRIPLAKALGRPDSGTVVLEIDLARGVLVNPPENPLAALRAMNAPSLRALREGLREGAKDDSVVGLFVHAGMVPISLAQVEELGAAIAAFGEHKPTLAWSEGYGELADDIGAYKLASFCSQVWVQPSGQVGIGGVHLGITLLRGLLEKAGLDPQISQRKEYKTAAEQFAGHQISDANREMMQSLANALMDDLVDGLEARRGLEPQQVWDGVNSSPVTPERALELGLVDRVGYRDEALRHLLDEWQASVDDLRFVHRWHAASVRNKQLVEQVTTRRQDRVAVVGLVGGIVTGRARPAGMGEPEAGADVVCEQLRSAARDEKVRAVVFRVDSPGGSAVASDTIWRAVHQVRESGRPVVVSMGDYAASGGYYVSMGADEICALPSTLTGSIGVFGGKLVTEGLYQKLGLVHEPITSGGRAQLMHGDRPFSEDEWRVLNEWLDRFYRDFTSKAAADRGMPVEQLEELARGRVWTGRQAADIGLVDHLGGMDLAIDRACALAGVERDKVQVRSAAAPGWLERVRPVDSSESVSAAGLGIDLRGLEALGLAAGSLAGVGTSGAGAPGGVDFGPEALAVRFAQWAGLGTRGALELPWRLRIR